MHHSYMIVISVLFAVVFAIMIYSMIKHRRSCGSAAEKFSGPTGGAQWFWALVPLAILAFVNFSLIGVTDDRTSVIPKKIELAAVQAPSGDTHQSGTERTLDKSGATRR